MVFGSTRSQFLIGVMAAGFSRPEPFAIVAVLPLSDVLQQVAGRRVLVVGDVIADEYLVGESSRISSEAPVPVLRYTGEHSTLGGAGNTAANVTSLGGAATLVAMVGDDPAGGDVARRCAVARIDFVPLRDGRPTTRKVRVISQQQQLLRIDYEETAPIDAARERELIDAIAARLDACDIVVVSDYAKGLLTNDVCREIVRRAKSAAKPVVVDPRPQHASFYWECDYLTPNWRESLGMLNEGDVAPTPEHVRRVGTLVSRRFKSSVLLTLGPRGIAYFDRDGGEPLVIAAEAQEVFDVSGAGDTVVAAFALARAAGCDHPTAVMLANRAAAIVVGKRGTATVTPDEIRRGGRL
jgi:D-beta-D-heptose 7-phosphate kinase/D-beta-D-heptose 1-phosphate adenosyltransferase